MTDRYQRRLDRYRPKVVEELRSIGDLMESAAENSRPVELDQQSLGRLARMDSMQRQAMALETQHRRQRRHHQLQVTLTRMDKGEFGHCAGCGDEIPDGRLAIDPTFRFCVACATLND